MCCITKFEYLLHLGKQIKSNKNNRCTFSGAIWDKECELLDISYFVFDIPDYFESIIQKHETFANNLPIQIYDKKVKYSRVIFQFKSYIYILELHSKSDQDIILSLYHQKL